MTRLYSGKSYEMLLRFTNIGEDICRAMEYALTLSSGIEVTEIGDSILASILPETTREVELTVKCGAISDVFEFKTIEINTVDIDGKTWRDSILVKINKEPVVFNIRSSKAVNGVVIVPNGKPYYFKTAYLSSNLYAAAVRVPKYQDDYLVVFSGGASADTEAIYSFAVDKIPAVNLDSLGLAALTKYRPNDTEALAAEILSSEEVYAYLPMNEANYYRVKLIH